jgi:hypothetical protein
MFKKNVVLRLGCLAFLLLFAQASWSAPNFFRPVQSYRSGGWRAVSTAVADVNGDGKLDLLVANECISSDNCTSGNVGVLLGNGDGTFHAAQVYSSGGYLATSIAVADVNGDGKPDVLVAHTCGDSTCSDRGVVGVLLGNGDGTFQPAQTYGAGGYRTVSVAVADVNRDGKPDVVVANEFIVCVDHSCRDNGSAGVLLGNGDGTFQTAQAYDSGSFYALSLAVGDVNRDGNPDLLVGHNDGTNHGRSTVSVLLGNGDGTFQTAQKHDSGGYQVTSIAVQDVNGDDRPDVLVVNRGERTNDFSNGKVSVLLGNGDGTFAPRISYRGASYASSIAVGDVNRDGKPDLLIKDAWGLGTWLGNGDGTFQFPGRSGPRRSPAPGYPNPIVWADLNGDGRPDVSLAEACFSNDCAEGGVGVLLNAVPFTTTTALTSNLNPSIYGQAVTLTATVSSDGPSAPTGTVTFHNGTKWLGKATLSGGVAILTTNNLPVGAFSIAARYNSDPDFVKSTSSAVVQEVSPAFTTTTIKSSLNPSVEGQPVTFTATVTSPHCEGDRIGDVHVGSYDARQCLALLGREGQH